MRLQVAFDYLMVFTFVLIVFTVMFSAIAKQRTQFSSEQSFAQLQVIAQTVASEISNAGQAGNGYTATFFLPSELSVLEYNISITKYGSVIASTDQFGQLVQAVAFSGQYNIMSNSVYLAPPSNTYYTIPTYNGIGTITFQNSLGTICIDLSCPSSANQVAQMTVLQQVAQSMALSGQSGYANFGSTQVFSQSPPPISMAVWFMPLGSLDSPTGNNAIVADDGSEMAWNLQLEDGDLLYADVCATICATLTDPNPVSAGTWYSTVVTFGSGNVIMYVNGVDVASQSLSGDLSTGTYSLCVGYDCYFNSGFGFSNEYFQGQVANLQFYNSALTAQQASQFYYDGISGPPVNTSSVNFWAPLSGNLKDFSGNGYVGIPEGQLSYPSVAELSASVTNSSGNAINGALIGFSSSLGAFTNGPSISNFTDSAGTAYAFLNQTNSSGIATVQVDAFNGNSTTAANVVSWLPLDLGQGDQIQDIGIDSFGPSSDYIFGNIAGSSWASPNYVAKFDGQTSYIQIPANIATQLSQLTINAWVNVSGPGTNHFSWVMGKYGAYSVGFCGRFLQVCYYDYGTATEHDSSSEVLSNTWYMLTAVINSGSEKVYLNGVQVLSNTLTINAPQNSFQIGGIALPTGTASQFFNGSASNIQLYSSALTQNQINQLYAMGIGGNPLPTADVSWWPLDRDALDYNGISNGTIYGNLKMVTAGISQQTSPSHLLYASFDGSNSYVKASNTSNFQSASNTLTISGWVNFASVASGSRGWLVSRSGAYGIGACGSSLNVCYYDWSTSTEHDSATTLSPNTWYMLAAVINGTANTETIYVNGVNVISGLLTQVSASNTLYVGYCSSCNQYLNGGVSDVQVYGGSLTQAQIQQLYQQGISATPLLNAQVLSWFPLDGDTNDYSNHNDAGIASNILYFSQNLNPPYWTPSLSSAGLYINGMDGGATTNQGPQNLITNSITASAWVYPVSAQSSGSGFEGIFSDWSQSSSTGPFELMLASSNTPNELYVKALSTIGGAVDKVESAGPIISTNSWYLITFVYNGTYENLYVNGAEVASSGPYSGDVSTDVNPMTIGYLPVYPYNYFNGTVADLQVYNSGLNDSQVSQLYNAGPPISQTLSVPLGGLV